MTEASHCLPLSGPSADPILYGVAQALAQLFPPVALAPQAGEHAEFREDLNTVESTAER